MSARSKAFWVVFKETDFEFGIKRVERDVSGGLEVSGHQRRWRLAVVHGFARSKTGQTRRKREREEIKKKKKGEKRGVFEEGQYSAVLAPDPLPGSSDP